MFQFILNGKSPLHFAAMQSNSKSLELLLGVDGIDVNLEDMILLYNIFIHQCFSLLFLNFKNFLFIYKTPLHYASKFGYLENVKLLVQHKDIAINPQVISI